MDLLTGCGTETISSGKGKVYPFHRGESMDAWLHKGGTVPVEVHSPPYHYHNTENFQYPLQTELANEM